jgi:hypothetical protein
VRSAAGVQVDSLDLDEPHVAFVPLGKTAAPDRKGSHLVGADPALGDRTGRTDLRRHFVLEPEKVPRPDRGDGELDVARLRSEVEGRRLPAEPVGGDRRQEVLGRVLLHVVETPVPVELELEGAFGDR